MAFKDGMKFRASPTTSVGFAPTEILNMEPHPRGTWSRRRGLTPYLSGAAPGTIYDLAVYDHYTGSTRYVDLVARCVQGASSVGLYKNRVYDGSAESTGGAWAQMGSSTDWSASDDGGAWAFRRKYAYYSDGAKTIGYDDASTFDIGLTTPSGTIEYAFMFNEASTRRECRQEPGWYEWTYGAYEEDRNVHSLPMAFQSPSTVRIAGSAGSVTTYHSLGGILHLRIMARIGSASVTFDPKATHYELYRRHPMTLMFKPARRLDDVRMVTRQATTVSTYVDIYNDGELGDKMTYAGSTPPPWRTVCECEQRWWYAGSSNIGRAYFSEMDSPENVAQEITFENHEIKPFLMVESAQRGYTGEAWVPVQANAGAILQALPFNGNALLLCENAVWLQTGTAPSQFRTHPIDTTIGAVSRKGGVVTPYGALWLSQQGIAWMRPNERPRIVSEDYLDFDDADSPTRLARAYLYLAVSCYDPTRKQALFAVAAHGSTGNDLVLCMDMELSTLQNPVFFYWKPTLATGEFVTALAAVPMPTDRHRIVATTNKKRTLYLAGSADHDGTSAKAIGWALRGWVGARRPHTRKGRLAIGMTHNAGYSVPVAASAWSRETMTAATPGEAADATATVTCSTNAFSHQELGIAGNPFAYVAFSESTAQPLELHDVRLWHDDETPEWPREKVPAG